MCAHKALIHTVGITHFDGVLMDLQKLKNRLEVTIPHSLSFSRPPPDSFVSLCSIDLVSSMATSSSLLDPTHTQAGSVGQSFILVSVFVRGNPINIRYGVIP